MERARAEGGYSLQLWAVLQDIHQLRAVYGAQAGTFLSNAGVVQVFNVADYETASCVSRLIGAITQAWNQLAATKTTGTSTHLTRRGQPPWGAADRVAAPPGGLGRPTPQRHDPFSS